MSFAHHLQRRAAAIVDRTFKEEIRYFPITNGAVDDARAVSTFDGVLRVADGRERNVGTGSGSENWGTDLAPGTAMLTVSRQQVAFEDSPLLPAVGDRLRAIERPGQPWFEVSHFDDREPARIVLHLSEA